MRQSTNYNANDEGIILILRGTIEKGF